MTTDALTPEGNTVAEGDDAALFEHSQRENESAKSKAAPPSPSPSDGPTKSSGSHGPHGTEEGVVHVYDDIQEQDNHLPNWWLYILYATTVFALGYWFYYHQLRIGPSSTDNYETEMAADRAAAAERARQLGTMTPEALMTMSQDRATVAEGRRIFEERCVSCHAAQGQGNIGPNLTDSFWINGGSPMQILHTVSEGAPPGRGMQAWGPTLGGRGVQSVVAYVLSIKNTNVSGRPPQGTRED